MLFSSSLRRRVLPRGAERVPGEVGELDEQLAGPHRVGADERGDRGERVVDEVRRDLRPQRPHLGAVEPGARLVELGQLQLARHVPRDLAGGPQQHRARRLVRQRGERADDRALDLQRHHDDAADLAVGPRSHWMLAVREHLLAAGADDLVGQRDDVRLVVVRVAVPGEHRTAAVGHRQRGVVEQRAQVRQGERGGRRREPLAQRGRGESDGVQGAEGGLLQRRRERVAPAAGDQDDHDRRQHADDHAEQHQQRGRPEQYLHGSYLTRRDSRRSASGRPPV